MDAAVSTEGDSAVAQELASAFVTGIVSTFVLPLGTLGCLACILLWLDPVARKNGGAFGAAVQCIMFELCLSIALTAAASLVWAVAAPKWLEKLLESLIKKTTLWMVILWVFVLACLVTAIFMH